MKNKVLALMGFARKSGNLVSGVNTCSFNLAKGRVKLMILAEDVSAGSKKKIMKEINKAGVKYVTYGTIDEMSHATGSEGRSVFGVLDENFAQSILAEINGGE